jgi:hypothetical protein
MTSTPRLVRAPLAVLVAAVIVSPLAGVGIATAGRKAKAPKPAPAQQPTVLETPAAAPGPNPFVVPNLLARDGLIQIDGVQYRFSIVATRHIPGILPENWNGQFRVDVTVTLQRADGRLLRRSFNTPTLRMTQSPDSWPVPLTAAPGASSPTKMVWTGPGVSEWADDVQLRGDISIRGNRGGLFRTTVRNIPFTTISYP